MENGELSTQLIPGRQPRSPLAKGPAMALTVRLVPSVTSISRDDWNSLFGPAVEDWDFFRACETAPPEGFSTSALVAFKGEQLVGAVPLFQVTFRVDMALEPTLGPLAAQLTRWAPRLMNPVILAMGSPQADECPLGVDPAAAPNDRRAILAALLEGLAIHARTLGCSVTALKDLRDTDTLWAHNILKQAGFARAACLPLAVLELPYRDETEYLATLSPRLRSELRRKMRQASSVMTELRDSIDDIHDEIVSLFQETRSNRRADYGSFDDVGPGFFLEVMHSLKGRARVMLCRHGGELVSFNMFLVEANRVLAKFIGMRYPQARDLNLYYFNWLLMVRYCIEQGIPLLQTGQTTYEIKMRMGSKLKKSWIYYKHRGPIMNQLFHAIAPFAALDRTDPDLRHLGSKAPYVPADYVPLTALTLPSLDDDKLS